MTAGDQRAHLIWATRGRSWGFRFLLDAGLDDPLPAYERAFDSLDDGPPVWRRRDGRVALRLSDPLGRRDDSGRPIAHDFVLAGGLVESVGSAQEGLDQVWPLVAGAYADVWDSPDPPSTARLRFDR